MSEPLDPEMPAEDLLIEDNERLRRENLELSETCRRLNAYRLMCSPDLDYGEKTNELNAVAALNQSGILLMDLESLQLIIKKLEAITVECKVACSRKEIKKHVDGREKARFKTAVEIREQPKVIKEKKEERKVKSQTEKMIANAMKSFGFSRARAEDWVTRAMKVSNQEWSKEPAPQVEE